MSYRPKDKGYSNCQNSPTLYWIVSALFLYGAAMTVFVEVRLLRKQKVCEYLRAFAANIVGGQK
jgi:hypothetical protein